MLRDFITKLAACIVVVGSIALPALAAGFNDWDVNSNDEINPAEFRTVFQDNGSFSRWDEDKSGTVTSTEIENGVGERQHAFNERYGDGWFKSWDANSDAALSEDEYYDGIYASYDDDGNKVIEEPEFGELSDDVDDAGWFNT